MREWSQLILNSLSVTANAFALLFLALFLGAHVSAGADAQMSDSEALAMQAGIGGSFSMILLVAAAVLALASMWLARGSQCSALRSGRVSWFTSTGLLAVWVSILLYLNLPS